jgi:hypothetical protein
MAALRAAVPTQPRPVAVVGVEAFEVEIEVHAGWGNADKIAAVGLPDTAVKESKPSAVCGNVAPVNSLELIADSCG